MSDALKPPTEHPASDTDGRFDASGAWIGQMFDRFDASSAWIGQMFDRFLQDMKIRFGTHALRADRGGHRGDPLCAVSLTP
jgi:hypothetical protein